jgi:hypothetical protein
MKTQFALLALISLLLLCFTITGCGDDSSGPSGDTYTVSGTLDAPSVPDGAFGYVALLALQPDDTYEVIYLGTSSSFSGGAATYSIPDVEEGTYYFGAFVDLDGSGGEDGPSEGDLEISEYNQITVTGDMEQNVTESGWTPSSAAVLFSDNFDDGDANGWLELPIWGISYSVADGRYLLSGSDDEHKVSGFSLNGDQAGVMSTPDYSIVANVTTAIEADYSIYGRFSSADTTGYFAYMDGWGDPGETDFVAIGRSDANGPVFLAQTPYDVLTGVEYWIRFELCGDNLRMKLWTGEVTDEPADWLLTCEDTAYAEAGSIGLFSIAYTINTSFDDIEVSEAQTWGN